MANTKNNVLALIASKIAGQGNQIDQAGALSEILAEIAGAACPIEASDLTKLTSAQLDTLNVGDKVVKVTGKQKHLYFVTYKGEGEGEGICISYNAAGYGETVSYDRTEDGWAYNSTDIKTYGE